jgi:hypothetical protein
MPCEGLGAEGSQVPHSLGVKNNRVYEEVDAGPELRVRLGAREEHILTHSHSRTAVTFTGLRSASVEEPIVVEIHRVWSNLRRES